MLRSAERFPHKPLITELRNLTVREGETAHFECRVISDLTPYIAWYKYYEVNGSFYNSTGEPNAELIGVSWPASRREVALSLRSSWNDESRARYPSRLTSAGVYF
jgi:Immunoglobulin I-set domain